MLFRSRNFPKQLGVGPPACGNPWIVLPAAPAVKSRKSLSIRSRFSNACHRCNDPCVLCNRIHIRGTKCVPVSDCVPKVARDMDVKPLFEGVPVNFRIGKFEVAPEVSVIPHYHGNTGKRCCRSTKDLPPELHLREYKMKPQYGGRGCEGVIDAKSLSDLELESSNRTRVSPYWEEGKGWRTLTVQEGLLRDAVACGRATQLARVVGSPRRIPILWTRSERSEGGIEFEDACVVVDPKDSIIHENDLEPRPVYMGDGGIRDSGLSSAMQESVSYGRNDGIAMLCDADWNDYLHFGDVPSEHERKSVLSKYSLPSVPCVIGSSCEVESSDVDKEVRNLAISTNDPTLPVSHVVVEFCCDAESRLSSSRYSVQNMKYVRRIRLTKEQNMETNEGCDYCTNMIRPYLGKVPIILWGSIPCTLGSTWQNINRYKPGWKDREAFLEEQFVKLHKNFMHVADLIRSHPFGEVVFEWPRHCALWKRECVVNMINKLNMQRVDFDGCMVGLVNLEGQRFLKPWTIFTTMPSMVEEFKNCMCDGSHEHIRVAGRFTANTALYPIVMIDKIHKAVSRHVETCVCESNVQNNESASEVVLKCVKRTPALKRSRSNEAVACAATTGIFKCGKLEIFTEIGRAHV